MQTITAKTGLLGLLGSPVGHSFSPLIHNTLSEKLKQELCYLAFDVSPENFEQALRGGFSLGVRGFNVTVPHKQRVIPFLEDIDESAKRIGAVNTLVRGGEGFIGYNTDMPGLHRAVSSEGIDLKGASAILLGAGGAARACGHMLGLYGAGEIFILNRSGERAAALAEELSALYPGMEARGAELSWYRELPKRDYLCLQATSVGLYPDTEKVLIEDPEFYQNISAAMDCIFNPGETRFLRLVRAAGGRGFNGMKMLLYQAVYAYELWTGVTVPDSLTQELIPVLEEALHG